MLSGIVRLQFLAVSRALPAQGGRLQPKHLRAYKLTELCPRRGSTFSPTRQRGSRRRALPAQSYDCRAAVLPLAPDPRFAREGLLRLAMNCNQGRLPTSTRAGVLPLRLLSGAIAAAPSLSAEVP